MQDPDSVDTSDKITYTYNRQGQPTTKTDQNGSVHSYSYDKLGRQTADSVTTLGDDVDNAILRITPGCPCSTSSITIFRTLPAASSLAFDPSASLRVIVVD